MSDNRSGETLVRILADPPLDDAPAADWDALVGEAIRQGVLPLFHRRTRGWSIPAEAARRAAAANARLALRTAVALRELERAAAILARHDIPVLLLKGVHLALDVYPDPSLRPMADVDILVRDDHLEAAERALLDAGYGPRERPDIASMRAWSNHLARLRRPHAPAIEIHWAIERTTSPFRISADELWRHSIEVGAGDLRVRALAPEHLLIHLCLHVSYHHRLERAALKQLCDLAAVLRRYELDWDRAADTATRWGAVPFVRFTCRLARDLLAAPVPARFFELLPPEPDEDVLVADARDFVLSPPETVPDALREAQSASGRFGKLRVLAGGLFPPPRRMATIYRLAPGSPMLGLWYLIRPFDLAARRGLALFRMLRPRQRRQARARERQRLRLDAALGGWAGETARPAADA